MEHVCVVGASCSGFRTAEALRAADFRGDITLVGAERDYPYDRPQLSKAVLLDATGATSPVLLATHADMDRLGIRYMPGRSAVALSPGPRRALTLDDGAVIHADRVVLACGAEAVQPFGERLAGVHTLRSSADSIALRNALRSARQLVVVGGGFIGSEVAAAARAHGVDVTIVEASPQPLSDRLGHDAGAMCANLHTQHGVRLLCARRVLGLRGRARVSNVVLDDGSSLPCDLVVVGVGARPVTDWLRGSDLLMDDGVLCNSNGVADGEGTVYAVGDVSRWWQPLLGQSDRQEHWSTAIEQAKIVASELAGLPHVIAPSVPYVWSDQYGAKLQIVGWTDPRDASYSFEERTGRAGVLYARQDRLVGAFALNDPLLTVHARRSIALRRSVSDFVQLDALPRPWRATARTATESALTGHSQRKWQSPPLSDNARVSP